MQMIVAADRQWGIGYRGKLLVSIPTDLRLFREMTEKKVLIVGRKTLATFPGNRPLPGRCHVILTGQETLAGRYQTVSEDDGKEPFAKRYAQACEAGEYPNILVHSVAEALEAVKQLAGDDVFVAGGESIYRQFLPWCDTVHVTRIDHVYQADAHFPDLDADPAWEITASSDEQTYFDLPYTFYRYERMLPVRGS